MNKITVGSLGEKIAKEYLEKQGYEIVAQNFKTRYLEIDLIAKDGKELVFVEVRTKKGELFGSPEASFTKEKLTKLIWNAKVYSAKINWQGNCRVDAVCIVLNKDNTFLSLHHYKNIIS